MSDTQQLRIAVDSLSELIAPLGAAAPREVIEAYLLLDALPTWPPTEAEIQSSREQVNRRRLSKPDTIASLSAEVRALRAEVERLTRALNLTPVTSVHRYCPQPHTPACAACGEAHHHPSHRVTA